MMMGRGRRLEVVRRPRGLVPPHSSKPFHTTTLQTGTGTHHVKSRKALRSKGSWCLTLHPWRRAGKMTGQWVCLHFAAGVAVGCGLLCA